MRDSRTVLDEEAIREELRKDTIATFAVYEGDVENGYAILGQSILIINIIESISEMIETIVDDAEIAIKKTLIFVQ